MAAQASPRACVRWGFLAARCRTAYLVVNADESEPSTFKAASSWVRPAPVDRGIIPSAFAIKAEIAFIYIRSEYYFGYTRLVEAVKATKKGFLGEKSSAPTNLRIVVHRGAGA